LFGRDELIEKIVDLAENLTPIALIGVGGIGKTSIALAVLHHDSIKQRFGDDRRFLRCDQFPASHSQLLRRLSNLIGAGIDNPEDLTALRPFLSSREMVIVLDNAESILDPEGTDAEEIYGVVEELTRFDNLWICVTSRISTIPPGYKHFDVPTLSADAARDAFYSIYDSNGRSDLVDSILEQLDFHPLCITLLATVAHQNKWGTDRLAREWEKRRTSVLQTRHKKSLAATIEISLASPMFQEFGPDARALLEVVAFFPQGIDENNANWLFPTISNGIDTLDGFCVLSLTHRSNGFITMLAPLRDYLSPRDPKLSPLLCAVKERYFIRMSVDLNPNLPEFGEAQWIRSEDVNVEHLLDVFTTIDGDSDEVWDACDRFMVHLFWHKSRPTVLRAKIEGLPDDHWCKPKCLYDLSTLFGSIGNYVDCKRLLIRTLELERERGYDRGVARALRELAEVNGQMGLLEGEQQVKEALEICERLGDTVQQAMCLITLAQHSDTDAAEEALFRVIDLLPEKGEHFLVCESHLLLGDKYQIRGKMEKALYHLEVALGIATSFGSHDQLFRIHSSLAVLFLREDRLDDGHAHVERAMLCTVNNAFNLGTAMVLRAMLWQSQHRLEEARSNVLRAADVFEKLGAPRAKEVCEGILQKLQEDLSNPVASGEIREFLQIMPLSTRIDFPF
jgi:tetratricopeptide (TPR) repeat protein